MPSPCPVRQRTHLHLSGHHYREQKGSATVQWRREWYRENHFGFTTLFPAITTRACKPYDQCSKSIRRSRHRGKKFEPLIHWKQMSIPRETVQVSGFKWIYWIVLNIACGTVAPVLFNRCVAKKWKKSKPNKNYIFCEHLRVCEQNYNSLHIISLIVEEIMKIQRLTSKVCTILIYQDRNNPQSSYYL